MNCNINTSVRNKTLRFFKQGTEWYADVPNHTLAQNRMVAGADTLLESMAHGGREVCVCMSADVEDPDAYRIKMKRIEHDPWGATYLAQLRGCALPRPALRFFPSTQPSCLLISPNNIRPVFLLLMAKSGETPHFVFV